MDYKMAISWECLVTLATLICFFSPVWILMWLIRWLFCKNALSHRLHLYGLSPVWILIWFIKMLFCEKALTIWLQWNCLSLVWILMWFIKSLLFEKSLSHRLHWYCITLICVIRGFHTYGVGLSSCMIMTKYSSTNKLYSDYTFDLMEAKLFVAAVRIKKHS